MKKLYFMLILFSMELLYSQDTKNVLFLGNSYTYVNNLPSLVQQAATSTGNTFTYDSNTPGGYRLKGHATNTTSINKIQAGNWDYVVLQDQSQFPSFPDAQVATEVYPYATQLSNLIKQHNPCAKTAFYMTWGRENGDAGNCGGWPPVCTYEGMDDLLRQRYQIMANDNNGIASPVGAVWRYLRTNHPTLDLYSGDGSHPSLTGSYAGAITFYCTLFRKDPTLVTFNSSLSTADATIIKNAVKLIVFDDLAEWNIDKYDPIATFNNSNTNEIFTFTNTSQNAISYAWDFGDGNTSTDENPVHNYTSIGDFTVTLTITNCEKTDVTTKYITVNALGINDENPITNFTIVKNPATNILEIESSKFTSGVYTLEVYSVVGQKIINTHSTFTVNQKININSLQAGMYFVQILNNNTPVFTRKFLKQ